MTHRLEKDNRTVSWTETRTIVVGYHDCGVCGVETPEPTMASMVEFAQAERGSFMWPSASEPGCMPAGWTDDREHGLICPDCTEAKRVALAARRPKRAP